MAAKVDTKQAEAGLMWATKQRARPDNRFVSCAHKIERSFEKAVQAEHVLAALWSQTLKIQWNCNKNFT